MTPFLFAVLALSVWRATHFVVEDTIPVVAKPRDWVQRRWPDSSFAYLVGCTYCSSVWVAGAHLAGVYYFTDLSVPLPFAAAAAWSILAAFGETVVDWLDRYGA